MELRDPDSVYPIFRSESKENLARILGHEENVHLHNLVVDLNSGKKEAFRAGHEAKHAENYRINSFHLGEGSPKQKFRAPTPIDGSRILPFSNPIPSNAS